MPSTIRQGIQAFLKAREAESPYLIPMWSPEMETQIMVHPGSNAVNEDSEGGPWTDGEQIWKNHRWPYKAGSAPYYNDETLRFDPGVHLTRVGSTWWNFVQKKSVAVVFDIDVDDEHAASTTTVGMSQLDSIVERLSALPYLTLVRSTGGRGVHVYCKFDPKDLPDAANHGEHTQVSLAVLAKMCEDVDYDFSQHIDVKGVVAWFWADSSPEGHPGFSLIKAATDALGAADIVEYLNALPQRKKATVTSVNSKGEVHPIEPEHREILEALEKTGYSFIWQPEFNMAHTHTCALKQVFDERAQAGNPLKGMFETVSQGTDRSKPNCYITTRPDGAFKVARFGNATAEHDLWQTRDQDTWCYFNSPVLVLTVMRKFASTYDDKGMIFEAPALERVVKALGKEIDLSGIQAPIRVTARKDGVMEAFFKASGGNYPGWEATDKGFTRELPVVHSHAAHMKSQLDTADKYVRHVISPQWDYFGWALNTGQKWVMYKSYEHVACVMNQLFGKEAGAIRAEMTVNPWRLVHKPFQGEYPGDRQWNKDAPQLAHPPADKPGGHRHYDMILDHLGKGLDDTVRNTSWCQKWGIQTGADYIRFWLAAIIQFPHSPLPYLFLFGPQNSGKSALHEYVCENIFTHGGTASATNALVSSSGYNAELSKCVVAYIEEKDLSKLKGQAYERIKEWTTARFLTIHPKGHTPYDQENTIHFIQCGNSPLNLPLEDGDTRVTVISVGPLKNIIPRDILHEYLQAEAPYFIRTLLNTTLPAPIDRMRVPTLTSDAKRDLERINQTPLESFASDSLIPCDGALVKLSDFYDSYTSSSVRPVR